MGTNSIYSVTNGTTIQDADINQYRTALVDDIVPRNSAGIPTDESANLGSSIHEWLRAHIASGYWSLGDIKPHHSYNGVAPIGQGWFPCLGEIINKANYDDIHGVGSWDKYIVSTVLDGKYSPSLFNTYLVGTAETIQSGINPILNSGNVNNRINLSHVHVVASHTHTTPSHNHIWYIESGTTAKVGQSFNANGTVANLTIDNSTWNTRAGNIVASTVSVKDPTPAHPYPDILGKSLEDGVYYTALEAPTTNSAAPLTDTRLSSVQDISPQSCSVVYYIRII